MKLKNQSRSSNAIWAQNPLPISKSNLCSLKLIQNETTNVKLRNCKIDNNNGHQSKNLIGNVEGKA